jgi:hypothetical protein
MPYSVDWYLVHVVADARLWGHITFEDLEAYTDRCVELLTEAQTHAPHIQLQILLDASDAESIPPIYRMFSQGMRTLRFRNRDTMFLITRNRQVRSVIEITSHLAGDHFRLRVFAERQEALEALTQHLEKITHR